MKKFIGLYVKAGILVLYDIISVNVAWFFSVFLLKEFARIDCLNSDTYFYTILFTVLLVLCSALGKNYRKIWRFASFDDYVLNVVFSFAAWVISLIAIFVSGKWDVISQIFCILSFVFSTMFVVGGRLAYRWIYSKMKSSNSVDKTDRTMIVGAGYAGNVLINEMLQPNSKYLPVIAVDDANDKFNRYVHGIRVAGNLEEIPALAKEYNISKIVIAIPSCEGSRKKKIIDLCSTTGCDVKILPDIYKVVSNENYLTQTKEIDIEDLLGRDPIKFDKEKNKALIEGKVCMVTGGGGSIGSELSRQIALNNPKQLVIVDIYENNAYAIQQELVRKYGDELNLEVRIASVRDYDKMDKIFEEFKPKIVFHAAAHKHVPLMEDSPSEAIKNNIFGTYNVARLAEKYNVDKFVLVSTDKAVNPTNVMGATKRCCEMIIEYMKQTCKNNTEYVAVRFGNVLGSNGSVVPLFREQIRNGGPVTVTHPDIIRFFMTIPEATSLILQAAEFANGGEIFVLDMGEPVKILTLAENVIKLSGKKPYEEVKIEFTGLRPGEKLYEELLMSEEGLGKTENKKIFIGTQTEVDVTKFNGQLEELRKAAYSNDNEKCVDVLASVVTTFHHVKN